jgi:hypothetical protein
MKNKAELKAWLQEQDRTSLAQTYEDEHILERVYIMGMEDAINDLEESRLKSREAFEVLRLIKKADASDKSDRVKWRYLRVYAKTIYNRIRG